jgi:hypothetical protein
MSATAPAVEQQEAPAQAPPPPVEQSALEELTGAGVSAGPTVDGRVFVVSFALLALVLQLGWIGCLTWLGWQLFS